VKPRFLGSIAFIFLFITSFTAFADMHDVELTIRYFDKKIVYPESEIPVKIEITNNSSEVFRFQISERRVFNLDFDVRTISNLKLDHAEEYVISKNSNQPLMYRELTLEPGEQYSFVEDLSKYVKVERPGMYVVTAMFYPQLFFGSNPEMIHSNQLSLSIRPSIGPAGMLASIDEESGEILRQMDLPPDQVVEYMLRARQRSQWDKFFLYLDLESLLSQDSDLYRRYLRMSDEERRIELERYKERFRRETTTEGINLIPNEFDIIRTTYTSNEGNVQVIERFRYPDFTEVKRFTYYLRKQDGIWTIYLYEVRNLGTE
jgi:hypothetical protein